MSNWTLQGHAAFQKLDHLRRGRPDVPAFMRESNRIEGIKRDPTKEEIDATWWFIELAEVKIADVIELVKVYQPDARIRDRADLNVRVGNHVAPQGGPAIVTRLRRLLHKINRDHCTPYWAHHQYETLHPFTDGNGRSGRALWLWHEYMRGSNAPLGFLHTWYYQSLQAPRNPKQHIAAMHVQEKP